MKYWDSANIRLEEEKEHPVWSSHITQLVHLDLIRQPSIFENVHIYDIKTPIYANIRHRLQCLDDHHKNAFPSK